MEEIRFIDSLGNKLAGVISIPKNAKSVVVISHGFTSNKNSKTYLDIQEKLNKKNIGTLRYDYYGHGPLFGHKSSPGVSADVTLSKTVESLKAAIKFVRSQGKYNIALLGSSYGGLMSLVVASQDKDIKALVLKSSVTEPIKFWTKRLGNKRIKQWEKEGVLHYHLVLEKYDLNYDYWKDLQKYNTLKSAENLSCPTFIVHGDKDIYVPIEQSYDLAKILNTKVKVISGAGHNYTTTSQYNKMMNAILQFLIKIYN
jgi:uncharacterized protein